MSLRIKYVTDCECGGTMSATEWDMTQEPGPLLEVSLDILGDMTVECDQCGDEAYVPAISDFIQEVD